MSENQTVETDASVDAFIGAIEHDLRRTDSQALTGLMQRWTGTEPRMWGPAIVGFGRYRYRYESGREGEMLRVGFSPRKANLTLYLSARGTGYADHLTRLGKHRTGASCLYINRLSDVDLAVLESLVSESWKASLAASPDAG